MNAARPPDVLDGLYPFLSQHRTDPGQLVHSLRVSVKEKAAQHQRVVDSFFAHNTDAVIRCAEAIAQVYRRGGRLFTMGNGGSASDAAHIAVEFVHPVTTGRPALPACDLSSDKTVMTAIANDVGFSHVYARQVAGLMRREDALIGVSTSGNSDNLLRAFLQARRIGAATIGLCGGDGGEMARAGLDHCLVVPSDSIHRTQECHVAIYHVLWDLVHTLLADDRGSAAGRAPTSTGESHEVR